MGLSEALTVVERARALDRPAAAARTAVQRVLRNQAVKDALHGVWLGHPLHPSLAQFTLGSLVSASLLDAVGGRQRESSTLIAAGLATTVPTVAAGWADYADSHEEQQRVGIVHAALNTTAVACYSAALVTRTRGGTGRTASLTGGVLAGLGAYLGGHLSFRRGLGPNQAESVPHTASEEWQPLGPLADIPDGEPVARDAAGTAVLVVRRGEHVDVWSDRCPHLSAPLHEGELDCTTGAITCPWHGSAFRVDDGSVLHGPATAPMPGFDSRVVDGVLQARVRTFPGVPAG